MIKTQASQSGSDTEGDVLPLAVIRMDDSLDRVRIEAEFAESGFRTHFAATADDFLEMIEHPEAFAAFLDLDLDRDLAPLVPRLMSESKVKWILISKPLSARETRNLYNHGAADILARPLPAALMLNRARVMLARFKGIPETSRSTPAVKAPPPVPTAPEPASVPASKPAFVQPQSIYEASRWHLEQIKERAVTLALPPPASGSLYDLEQSQGAAGVCEKGFSRCFSDIETLLSDCRDQVHAERILLVSSTPDESDPRLPLVLDSNRKDGSYTGFDSWVLPELEVACARGETILIPSELYAAPQWRVTLGVEWTKQVSAQAPQALAILPIFAVRDQDNKSPIMYLIVVLTDASKDVALEPVLSTLCAPYLHYAFVDFLSRVYRGQRQST